MSIFKEKKNLILTVLLDIFICIVGFIILFFYLSNNTVEVSSLSNSLDLNNTVTENILIADLDNETDKNEAVTEIVTDEKATDKELKEEKVSKKEEQKSTSPYFIKVNYKANVVTIYTKDKDGKYTVPYKAMVCSTGTYTPRSGIYKTSSKHRWGKLIHDVYGQYATRIVGSILFHSVPYSSNSADTLLYEEYDKLGTTASAGCVRLTIKDCKWIYDNCPRGTLVEFYKSSDPGPLGKPTAQKISSVEECRNWDPTDLAINNPWHTYKPEEEKPSEDVSNSVTNDVTNNISNNTTNNSVIDNNIVDNSINSNNVVTDTNSTVNNNTVNNNINNNTVNNSTINNNTIDNSGTSGDTTSNSIANNNTTDSSNNLDNANSGDNSTVNENIITGDNDNSAQNNSGIDNNVNNLIFNNII